MPSSPVGVEEAKRPAATSANSSPDRTLWSWSTKVEKSGWSVLPVEAAATTSSRPTKMSLCCAAVAVAAAAVVVSFGVLSAPTAASCIW